MLRCATSDLNALFVLCLLVTHEKTAPVARDGSGAHFMVEVRLATTNPFAIEAIASELVKRDANLAATTTAFDVDF